MSSLNSSLKFRLSFLVLFFVVSFFVNIEYEIDIKNIELESIESSRNFSEFKVDTIVFEELKGGISSANLKDDYKPYSRAKKHNIAITTLNFFGNITNSCGLVMNSKVGLYILYSSLKLLF